MNRRAKNKFDTLIGVVTLLLLGMTLGFGLIMGLAHDPNCINPSTDSQVEQCYGGNY